MGFNIPYTDKKRVVIIGGGFGGLKLAEKLKKSKFQVVLIDKNNYHQFPPLLYQVASSGLEYNEISFPYRKIFQKRKNFYFGAIFCSMSVRWQRSMASIRKGIPFKPPSANWNMIIL